MADTDSTKFKIRFDDEEHVDGNEPQPELPKQVEDLQLKKLNSRINRVAFLLLLILGLVSGFVYFDVRSRLALLDPNKSPATHSDSKDSDLKFSSLSVRQAKFEALLESKISALENSVEKIRLHLEQIQKGLSATTEIEKKLASIDSDLKKSLPDIKTLQEKTDKEIAKIVKAQNSLQKEIDTLKKDTASIASSRVEKKTLDLTVRHFEERFIPQKLDDLEKSLLERIKALQNKINDLEIRQRRSAAVRPPPPAESTESFIPSGAGSPQPATPQPGKIIEQELKE